MNSFLQNLNKFYLVNAAVSLGLILSVILTFFVQFRVEAAQDKISHIQNEIADYKDELQLLEVNFVYLTRPERLRELSARYLKENNYALANQIKSAAQLEQYHLANVHKLEEREVALR